VKFLAITLIVHAPHPITGVRKSTTERLREVVDNAQLAESLGFEEKVTWSGRFRPDLHEAETWPRPLQEPIRIWHGSATSRESVDLAAKWGDPLFSANVTNPIEPYAELIRYYRERWEHYGHDPQDAVVGAGSAGYFARKRSQDALEEYRPVYEASLAFQRKLGLPVVFETFEDHVERSSALIGSPEQIIDKVHRYHEVFGHRVLHLHADAGGLTERQHIEAMELFQSDIAPTLRREIPDPPWPTAADEPDTDDLTPQP